MDNGEDKYYYEWPADKFESRLFIIRDILNDFFDTGEKPVFDKESDPFWDPPNSILIGQSFIQLQPLAFAMENCLDAMILSIDGEGAANGMLSIGYEPCEADGSALDEDNIPDEWLEAEEVEDMIGQKDMYFKVFVKFAKGLPEKLCLNPYVTYQMQHDE